VLDFYVLSSWWVVHILAYHQIWFVRISPHQAGYRKNAKWGCDALGDQTCHFRKKNFVVLMFEGICLLVMSELSIYLMLYCVPRSFFKLVRGLMIHAFFLGVSIPFSCCGTSYLLSSFQIDISSFCSNYNWVHAKSVILVECNLYSNVSVLPV
jgi:hypothetical protein